MGRVDDCVFCRIVAGESPASVVHEDELVVAFLDILPVANGHTLVVPKIHSVAIGGLDQELGGHVFEVGMELAQAVRRATKAEGINLFVADGAVAGQTVFHFHLHVIPRYEGDGLGFRHPPGYGAPAERSDLDREAARIREALGRPSA